MGYTFFRSLSLIYKVETTRRFCRSGVKLLRNRAVNLSYPAENLVQDERDFLQHSEKFQEGDSQFKRCVSLLKSRKQRERLGDILLEGNNLINCAISAGIELKALYFTHKNHLSGVNLDKTKNVELFSVLNRTLQLVSGISTSPGVMGIFKRPSVGDIKMPEPMLNVDIVCDNIRDPGNLGSIIRNAASAGCRNIFLLKGCVDPWESKVLKEGGGGHFSIPITGNIEWTELPEFIPKHSKIFIADNSGDIDLWEQTPDAMNYIEQGTVESAEGNEYDSKEETKEVLSEYKMKEETEEVLTEHDLKEETEEVLSEHEMKEETEEVLTVDVPCYLYSSIEYPMEDSVLYVGGETHGVDNRIVQLALDKGGMKIKIPLENSMDSLNSSFAMTIILYEMKRQFSDKLRNKSKN